MKSKNQKSKTVKIQIIIKMTEMTFDLLVKLGCSVSFIDYVNVVKKAFAL